MRQFALNGVELLEKTARFSGSGAVVYVPVSWGGRRVVIILLDDKESKKKR